MSNYYVHFTDEEIEALLSGEKRFSPDNLNQNLTLLPTTPQNRSRMPLDIKWIFPHHSVTFFMPSHFQEVNLLRGQLGDRLNVELDTAPTLDLNRVLDEMRCQYETVLANNRREAEEWFAVQVSTQIEKTARLQTSAFCEFSNGACVSDRRAESAATVQCGAAAGLPDGDLGTETHSQCSGN